MDFRVVLTDQAFPDTNVERERLAEIGASLEVLSDSSAENIRARAGLADAVLTTYAPLDRTTIEALERCKIIARYGVGVDNIDLEAAREHGVVVTNVPDYCVEEVADHAMALLLAAARRIVTGSEIVRAGGWGVDELVPVHRLRGRTLGLLGYGRIASQVASRAQAFGLRVAAFDPYVPESEVGADEVDPKGILEELLGASDYVSVHVPLTDSTRSLLNSETIARMKRGAVLINTSRGPVVSTEAVIEALRVGHLAAACLDVFEVEPPDVATLRDVPNLIATPHSAFYSEESLRESQAKASDAIVAVLTGQEPAYRVV